MNRASTTREAYSLATLAADWRVVGRQDHTGKWRYVVPPEPLRLGADRGEISLVTRREEDGSFALLGRRPAPV